MPATHASPPTGLDTTHIDAKGTVAGREAAYRVATRTEVEPGDRTLYVVHTWRPPGMGPDRCYVAADSVLTPLDWDPADPPHAGYLAGKLVRGTAPCVADVLARFLAAFSAAYLAETERMSREVF